MTKSVPYADRKFDREKANKYDYQYKKEHYDRINYLLPKGYKDIIKNAAETMQISPSEFIRQAIQEKIDKIGE